MGIFVNLVWQKFSTFTLIVNTYIYGCIATILFCTFFFVLSFQIAFSFSPSLLSYYLKAFSLLPHFIFLLLIWRLHITDSNFYSVVSHSPVCTGLWVPPGPCTDPQTLGHFTRFFHPTWRVLLGAPMGFFFYSN